jgi:CxxC motif-containing protein (DUF1111 family)
MRTTRWKPQSHTLSLLILFLTLAIPGYAQVDPGPRGGVANAGGSLAGLSPAERGLFNDAKAVFAEVDSVSGGVTGEAGSGLGPTFNANSCASCHAQPAVGGTSPHPGLGQVRRNNPQVAFATLDRQSGRNQIVPSFILADGPVREARFVTNPDGTADGGVHGLFTIAGRVDAPASCNLAQPDFANQLAHNNVIFRIPTPTFGLGLVDNTSEEQLISRFNNTASARAAVGIGGHFNRNGNDGSITRFGWKAQNKSLLIFAGEAYNVEQGVSNELFQNERGGVESCEANPTPEDHSHIFNGNSTSGTLTQMSADTVSFANFMRLLAPPTDTINTASELNGQSLFNSIGCNLCHTQTLVTEESVFTNQTNVTYHPFSDFAVHHMGTGLSDRVSQGNAGPDEFRSAPLWGAGQRIFFLHDGRAGPPVPGHAGEPDGILKAILEHQSPGSEANTVIGKFNALTAGQKQDILNFLRAL